MDRIGRYKIVRELGRGAMGVVYHAIDPNIGRPVAIKTIHFGDDRTPEERDRMRERLFREARSAGMLSHPGIVTVYDVEQHGEIAYIAMEYVDGPTLEQVLSEPKAIDQTRMFSILAQTAAALDYAHSKGIVHRDIKPANIMLAADGTSKITDFGIAKIATAEHLTMTGSIVGTPHYMSPEQVQGHQVDGRSDQFSLAVIAYEMLTGEKPYTGEHLTTVVYKIVAEEPVMPHRINPTLSALIEVALAKAMAKKPDARYRSCQEFVDGLEKAGALSKGWKPAPRGGLLTQPTMAKPPDRSAPAIVVAPPVLPPPVRPKRAEVAATTSTIGVKKKSGFLPFLLAALVAGGLLALIGWQVAPWMLPGGPDRESHTTPAKEEPQVQVPAPAPQTAAAPPVTPPVALSPEDKKPSPVGPAPEDTKRPEPGRTEATKPEVAKREPGRQAVRNGVMQDVVAISSPSGARASLDGDTATGCSTPCSLSATPGKHTLAFFLQGYQIERREILVGSATLEMAPVILKAASGTLWLTSDPVGAAVSVNGKRIDMLTPAQIPLALGTYTVEVTKDGHTAIATVEIHNGINYWKIPLGQ